MEFIRRAIKEGKIVSLLLLDAAGAFDTVNPTRLLQNMPMARIHPAIVQWVASFLSDRSTCIRLPEYTSSIRGVRVGILQGSPISPILYLFYNAPLLHRLSTPTYRTLGTGYVDDITNSVANNTIKKNISELQRLHKINM